MCPGMRTQSAQKSGLIYVGLSLLVLFACAIMMSMVSPSTTKGSFSTQSSMIDIGASIGGSVGGSVGGSWFTGAGNIE
eukprot:1356610-Amorphochlora_amoeboformis.AAC.1